MAQFIIKNFLIKKGAQKNSGPTNQSGPILAQPAQTAYSRPAQTEGPLVGIAPYKAELGLGRID